MRRCKLEGRAATEAIADPVPAPRQSAVTQMRAEPAAAARDAGDSRQPRRVLELKPLPQGKLKEVFRRSDIVRLVRACSDHCGGRLLFCLCIGSIRGGVQLRRSRFQIRGDRLIERYCPRRHEHDQRRRKLRRELHGGRVSVEFGGQSKRCREVDLVGMYSRPDLDWLARLDPSAPIERIVGYWRRMVSATYDQITGLGVARFAHSTRRRPGNLVCTGESLGNARQRDRKSPAAGCRAIRPG